MPLIEPDDMTKVSDDRYQRALEAARAQSNWFAFDEDRFRALYEQSQRDMAARQAANLKAQQANVYAAGTPIKDVGPGRSFKLQNLEDYNKRMQDLQAQALTGSTPTDAPRRFLGLRSHMMPGEVDALIHGEESRFPGDWGDGNLQNVLKGLDKHRADYMAQHAKYFPQASPEEATKAYRDFMGPEAHDRVVRYQGGGKLEGTGLPVVDYKGKDDITKPGLPGLDKPMNQWSAAGMPDKGIPVTPAGPVGPPGTKPVGPGASAGPPASPPPPAAPGYLGNLGKQFSGLSMPHQLGAAAGAGLGAYGLGSGLYNLAQDAFGNTSEEDKRKRGVMGHPLTQLGLGAAGAGLGAYSLGGGDIGKGVGALMGKTSAAPPMAQSNPPMLGITSAPRPQMLGITSTPQPTLSGQITSAPQPQMLGITSAPKPTLSGQITSMPNPQMLGITGSKPQPALSGQITGTPKPQMLGITSEKTSEYGGFCDGFLDGCRRQGMTKEATSKAIVKCMALNTVFADEWRGAFTKVADLGDPVPQPAGIKTLPMPKQLAAPTPAAGAGNPMAAGMGPKPAPAPAAPAPSVPPTPAPAGSTGIGVQQHSGPLTGSGGGVGTPPPQGVGMPGTAVAPPAAPPPGFMDHLNQFAGNIIPGWGNMSTNQKWQLGASLAAMLPALTGNNMGGLGTLLGAGGMAGIGHLVGSMMNQPAQQQNPMETTDPLAKLKSGLQGWQGNQKSWNPLARIQSLQGVGDAIKGVPLGQMDAMKKHLTPEVMQALMNHAKEVGTTGSWMKGIPGVGGMAEQMAGAHGQFSQLNNAFGYGRPPAVSAGTPGPA